MPKQASLGAAERVTLALRVLAKEEPAARDMPAARAIERLKPQVAKRDRVIGELTTAPARCGRAPATASRCL